MNTPCIEIDRCSHDELRSFSACLRFCATLLRYPDQAVFAGLAGALPYFNDLHAELVGHPFAALPLLEKLQLSYTSLFVANPAGLPAVPYLSCRLEQGGETYGAATMELRKLTAAEGVKVDNHLGEPEDHVGVVFDFAALLAERSVDNPDKLLTLHHVMENYLSRFLPGFAMDVSTAGPEGFYADAAIFCTTLIEKRYMLLQSLTIETPY